MYSSVCGFIVDRTVTDYLFMYIHNTVLLMRGRTTTTTKKKKKKKKKEEEEKNTTTNNLLFFIIIIYSFLFDEHISILYISIT